MSQYLDKTGLQYFWQKIVSKFVAKESGKGLSTNDYTTTEKQKLAGIANNANNYSLPTASSSTLGGIKVGSGLSISNGVLSASGSNPIIGFNILYSLNESTIVTLSKSATVVLVALGYDKGLSDMDWREFIMIPPGGSFSSEYVGSIELSSNGRTLTFTNETHFGKAMFGYIAISV